MAIRLNSLNALILAGFAVAFVPLIVVIVIATTHVNALGRQSTHMVTASVGATRDTQTILEVITDLERGGRQYQVLGNMELLEVYRERHERLLATIGHLRHILPQTEANTTALEDTASGIFDAIERHPHDSREVAGAVQAFERMRAIARRIFTQVNALTDERLSGLRSHADQVVESIYWLAAGLISLAGALGLLFTILIARSVRQLGHGIRQLGEGELDREISVSGPGDLKDLGERLDWLRLRLVDLEQEKNTFLRHISHELKTPLTNIREGAELLTDGSVGPLEKQPREVMRVIHENSLVLQKNIENLLNFSSWQRSRTSPERVVFDLRELITKVVAGQRLPIANGGLQVVTDLPELRLASDPEKFQVIFDNLISNAVKFSPPRGTILIRASQHNGNLEIVVADEGPGIPTLERDRVFDAFYQGSAPQRGHVRGTGIGLAVVRECVRILGGRIEIRERESGGAAFCVHFRCEEMLADWRSHAPG